MITIPQPQLTQIANDFLREHYGLTLEIPIKRNNRLRIAMARVIFNANNDDEYTPSFIDIAGFMFEYADVSVMIDTLLHECVHYALYHRGEPYDDGHPHFEAELKRLGISATDTCNVGIIYDATCGDCGEVFHRNKPRDYVRYSYVCPDCKTLLETEVKRVYNGTEAV